MLTFYTNNHAYSDIAPVYQLIKEQWQQAPQKDASKGFAQHEIGMRYQHSPSIDITLASRYDAFITTNYNAAWLYYTQQQEQPLNLPTTSPLSLALQQQRSNGIKLAYHWRSNRFNASIEAGYWQVSRARHSTLTGNIASADDNSLQGQLDISEHYSHNNVLKRPNNGQWENSGTGITLNTSVSWQPSSAWLFQWQARDLFSRFKHSNLGYSQGQLNTNNRFINDNGTKAFRPFYQGIETTRPYRFTLPATHMITTRYQHNQLQWLTHIKHQGHTLFPNIGIAKTFDNVTLTGLFDVRHHTPTITLATPYFSTDISMQRAAYTKARQLQFNLSVHWPL